MLLTISKKPQTAHNNENKNYAVACKLFFLFFFLVTQNRQYFCTTQKELRTSLLPLEKFCGKTALRDFYAAVVGWQYSPQSMGNYDDYSMNLPESGKITRPMGEQRFCVVQDPVQAVVALIG